jgi:hypothetical protein
MHRSTARILSGLTLLVTLLLALPRLAPATAQATGGGPYTVYLPLLAAAGRQTPPRRPRLPGPGSS